MSAMLEPPEYSTVLASSGQKAVERIQQDPPYDLVLSDMMMQGVDGMDLLERVRELHPDTPMVMVTPIHDVAVAMAAIRKGAYDYLLRPFEKEQLLSTVKRALDYRRLVQQNAMYRQNLEQLVTARTGMLSEAITDLERSYDITLEALGDALDLKDAETEGHSKRVTAFTIALARGMGIAADQIRVIARGAFLHDIGKMAIPDAILLKPDGLKSEEQKVMREHCARGYQILRKIPFLQEAAEIVYSHQEHYDGSGYPGAQARGDPARGPDLRDRRYARRDHFGPPLPQSKEFHRGARRDQAMFRHPIRPQRRRSLSELAGPDLGGPSGGDHP